jgi:thioredoxin 1
MVNEIKTNEFETKVLGADKPVFVDFWAVWCGPCRMVSPVVEALSEQYEGKVDFYKVNVDEEPELARQFGIMSIPTLMLFKDGELFDQTLGVQPEAELKAFIDKAL